jgi:putative membrane protein
MRCGNLLLRIAPSGRALQVREQVPEKVFRAQALATNVQGSGRGRRRLRFAASVVALCLSVPSRTFCDNRPAPRRIPAERTVADDDSSDPVTTGRRLVYFAAERTLMAWIRSALGLMALGFVIDRFGLILRHVIPEAGERLHPQAFSFWAGTVLVVLGAVMAFVAAGRYLHFSLSFHREGNTNPRHGILIGVVFTAILGVLGLVIAGFLIAAT